MVDRLVNSEINTKRIANVEYCFGINGVPLGVPGRVLVGEGVLTKICRKKPKSRQFFLFNDILVYGTILINKKKYAQQHIIPLEGLAVEDLPDEVVMKNGWLIKTSSKSFAVYAGSPSEKAEWIRHIKKCASDLLEQTGRKAPVEHAAVWIPDSVASVCMHCNQTQFTMLNRRHHLVCGGCSRNRVVILHQSKNPVRVCNACYEKCYNHLTKPKKSSTCAMHSEKSITSTWKAAEARQLASDAAEIQQVVRDCMQDDATNAKDSRVEEWVSLASEQVSEHLSKAQKESENSSVDEAIEAIKLVDEVAETEEQRKAVADVQANVEQLNGSKVDSYNDQTSDSDDEHLNDLSSVEDILDELIGKPTFYEDVQPNKDVQREESKSSVDDAAKGELEKTKQIAEVNDFKETDKAVQVEKHLGDEKVNEQVAEESSDKKEIKESSSETEVQTENELNEAAPAKTDVEVSGQKDASTDCSGNTAEPCEEKTSF